MIIIFSDMELSQ